MKKMVIGAFVLLLAAIVPTLSLASQFTTTTHASISGNTATVTVQSDTATPNALVDLELYDSAGNRVAQEYTDTNIPNGLLSCTWNISVPAGTYTLKTGIFNSTWSTLYSWNDN